MNNSRRKPVSAAVIFGLLIAATLCFGMWGFWKLGDEFRVLNLLYKSIQLFSLESGSVDGQVPWQLEVARWLGSATLLSGLFELVKTMLGDRYRRWRIRYFRKHHIVAGLNEQGFSLANDLLRDGERVVAMDLDPEPSLLERFRENGGIWLPYDVSPKFNYDAVGVKNAASCTIVSPEDSLNLSVAYAIEESDIINSDGSKLGVYAHVGDVALRDLLDRNSFFVSSPESGAVIRTFNNSANMARMILSQFPLETAGFDDGPVNTARQVHLVLPQLTQQAVALLIQTAKIGHYLGQRKVYVHLVSGNATQSLSEFLCQYPSIKNCYASIEAIDVPTGGGFGRAVGEIIKSNQDACFTVIPCFDSNPEHLATVLRLQEEIPSDTPYRMLLPYGLEDFLSSAIIRHPQLSKIVCWFSDDGKCCCRAAVFNEELDRAAKVIHENWVVETERQIENVSKAGNDQKVAALKSKPAFKPWGELAEDLKSANRSQADHAAIKVRAAGLDPSLVTGEEWVRWCSNNPGALEQLARVEHERWAAHLWVAGWSYATVRDDARKLHDNLVNYDDLDEPTKEYDVDAVRGIASYF